MKKILNIFICFICLFVIVGCSNSKLDKISYDEFNKLLEDKESFVLYIGSTTCHNCKSFSPKFEEVIDEYDIDDVKYVEIDKFSDEDKDSFNKTINVSGTPTVVFIEDGEEKSMTNRINGNVDKDKIISRFKSNGYIDD